MARPTTISQDNDVVSTRLELFRVEYTATRRRHSQERKELGGTRDSEQAFRRMPMLSEVTAAGGKGSHLFQNRILVALVEKVRCGMRPILRVRRSAEYSYYLIGLRIR